MKLQAAFAFCEHIDANSKRCQYDIFCILNTKIEIEKTSDSIQNQVQGQIFFFFLKHIQETISDKL